MHYKLMLSKLSQDIHRWKKENRILKKSGTRTNKRKLSAFKVQDPKIKGMVRLSNKQILQKADLQKNKKKLSSNQLWYQPRKTGIMGEVDSYHTQA